jgi:hypothetical protein
LNDSNHFSQRQTVPGGNGACRADFEALRRGTADTFAFAS